MTDHAAVAVVARADLTTDVPVRGPATVGPLRCASVLKPLYAWVSASDAGPAWPDLMAAAVTASDNAATDVLVAAAGGLPIVLGRIGERTGVRWRPAPTWGRVLVRPHEVAAAYRALAWCSDPAAAAVLATMRRVRARQQLGAAAHWATATGQDPAGVGVKTGWDLSDDEPSARTHAVVLDADAVAVVLTRVAVNPAQRARWEQALAAGGPDAVLPLHHRWAGNLLRRGLDQAASTPSA